MLYKINPQKPKAIQASLSIEKNQNKILE